MPASRAAEDSSKWVADGVAMSITSMSVRATTACQSAVASGMPMLLGERLRPVELDVADGDDLAARIAQPARHVRPTRPGPGAQDGHP